MFLYSMLARAEDVVSVRSQETHYLDYVHTRSFHLNVFYLITCPYRVVYRGTNGDHRYWFLPYAPWGIHFSGFLWEKKNGEQSLIKLFHAQDLTFQQAAAK